MEKNLAGQVAKEVQEEEDQNLLNKLSYQLSVYLADEIRSYDSLLMHVCTNCERK